MGIAFALTSAAAFEATGQLAGPFLVDRGVESSTIGLFFGVVVVAAMLGGGLLGGAVSDRWGRRRSVAVFLAGFVAMILLLAAADAAGGTAPAVLLGLLAGMYFFVGLFTAASYALFMDLTDPRLGGTQFSTFMAATNGCEAWSTWTAGRIAGSAGYASAFVVLSVASVLSLFVLKHLRRRPEVDT
jgi:MFS family permease